MILISEFWSDNQRKCAVIYRTRNNSYVVDKYNMSRLYDSTQAENEQRAVLIAEDWIENGR